MMRPLDILVIDDDVVGVDDLEPPRQLWFAERLAALGHTVTAAHSSAEACRLLRERSFDLAFFDHDLGEDATGSTIAGQILRQPEDYRCPSAVWVHSHNPIGAENIASKFRSAGVPTRVLDYGALKAMSLETLEGLINALVPAASHKYELGSLVEVDLEISQPGHGSCTEVSLKGTCRLLVVGHLRDCDMTPLYVLADVPVKYPLDAPPFAQELLVYKYLATLVESGYGEESLRPTGERVPLKHTVAQWLEAED